MHGSGTCDLSWRCKIPGVAMSEYAKRFAISAQRASNFFLFTSILRFSNNDHHWGNIDVLFRNIDLPFRKINLAKPDFDVLRSNINVPFPQIDLAKRYINHRADDIDARKCKFATPSSCFSPRQGTAHVSARAKSLGAGDWLEQ